LNEFHLDYIESTKNAITLVKTETIKLYNKLLVLTWYERAKWGSYIWVNLSLSAADPAGKLLRMAGAGFFVKIGKKVDDIVKIKILKDLWKISDKISNWHAFDKHIKEFEKYWIKSKVQFKSYIENTIKNSKYSKLWDNWRMIFYNEKYKSVVIYNPKDPDLWTTFIPWNWKTYFNEFK